MVEFPLADVYTTFLIFARVGALLFMVPVFASKMIPRMFITALALFISAMVLPLIGPSTLLPTSTVSVFLAIGGEVLIGFLMGYAVRLLFFVVEFAADVIAQESALMRSTVFDPLTQTSGSIIGPLYYYMAAVLLFATGAHLEILAAFVRSYAYIPAGLGLYSFGGSVWLIVAEVTKVFTVGIKIAAPLIALAFIVNLIFAILGRVAPKVNVLILSFGVRILLSFVILIYTVELTVAYLYGHLEGTAERMLHFIVG